MEKNLFPKKNPLPAIAFGVFLGLAVLLRVIWLDRIPGVNGDEAFWGFQVSRLLRGEPFIARSLTGNPLNPFFVLPTLLLTALFQPSFWILRAPALMAQLGLLAAAYPMVRHRWGKLAATLTLIGLAASPTLIGYSRFGWDPAQSAPACFVALCLAFDRRVVGTALAFAAAFWIHPTNVFVAPLLLALLFRNGLPDTLRPSVDPRARRLWITGALTAALLFGLRSRLLAPAATLGGAAEWQAALQRLTDGHQWARFATALIELWNGVTFFDYVAGPAPADFVALADVILGLPVALALGLGLWLALRQRDRAQMALLGGLLASLGVFYLRTGLLGVSPHTERYGQWLLAPLAVATAVSVSRLCRSVWAQRTALVLALGWGVFTLGSTQDHYFDAFFRTGGLSHHTFWTGMTEPKKAAFEQIRFLSPDPGTPVVLQVEDYWPLYPIAFLAWKEPRFQVRLADPQAPLQPGDFWLVNPGSPEDQRLGRTMDGMAQDRWEVPGFGNRPVFALYHKRAGHP